MGQAGRYEGELDARKRACPVRWRGKALSYHDMLIPLSYKWGRACTYCVTPVKGHHFSGEQSPVSFGNGNMLNVSLTSERQVRTIV